MENMVNRELPAQRWVWRQKILELREDTASIRRQAEYYHRMVRAKEKQEWDRENLLRRRALSRKGKDTNVGVDADAENAMHDLSNESTSLCKSNNMVHDMLLSGQVQLTNLIEQRSRMIGIKRVVLDISNKLGMTNFTMRVIKKRDLSDARLVYGGMVVMILLIFIVWF